MPRLIDELAPGFAAQGDNIVVWFENSVGQLVVAYELPDEIHGAPLGRSRRQGQKRSVGRDHVLVRDMPSGLVEEEDGVGARRHLG